MGILRTVWAAVLHRHTVWGLSVLLATTACQTTVCSSGDEACIDGGSPSLRGGNNDAKKAPPLLGSVGSALMSEGRFVTRDAGKAAFTLFASDRAASIWVSDQDHAGVIRVAEDLQADIERVSGMKPSLTKGSEAPSDSTVVIVGTLGKSPLIDTLVDAGKLDVSSLTGKWEMFLMQTVEAPMAGVEKALVIAGSDKRGAIYGVYELSEQMGVSPWYDLADVPPAKKTELHVLPGVHTLGEPAVKYRGLFINDENPGLLDWYIATYGNSTPGFNSKFYVRVFELILRLKGNYMWPAMWGKSFNADDPENPRLADEYGVVMGTSHHEPLTRSEQEWYDTGHTAEQWRYDQESNAAELRAFWTGGIERMGERETLVTVGMRGSGDVPNPSSGIPLMERIVTDQRNILTTVTGKPANQIPQVWTLYKEVQTYYDEGMEVPDDITLMFADDNWGNIRRVPPRNGAARSGGYGIYYHFDYVGGPRSYKWLNTNPIPRVWEQMRLAHAMGARQVWIVNVGDLKPMEYPLHFFMDLAWDPEGWTAARLKDYPRRWAEAQFGPEHAEKIGYLVSQYSKFNGRRKPELLSGTTYSLENFREADIVVDEYNALVAEAEEIEAKLPEEARDAYFQLVLFPILACANLNEMWVSVGKNGLYNSQGRASTNVMADRVKTLFDNDAEITKRYHTINGGKWNHMMKQTHISYTNWDDPDVDVVPATERVQVSNQASLGVAIEGSRTALTAPNGTGTLPALSVYYPDETRSIEVFNRGSTAFDFTATSSAPYVTLTPSSGSVGSDTRVVASVDWSQVPVGNSNATLTIAGAGGEVVVQLPIVNPETPRPDDVKGFVEANNYVSIEAVHYTGKVDGANVQWAQVPDLGRTLSAVTPEPPNAAPVTPGDGTPRLDYQIHFFTTGQVTVDVYLSPSLPVFGSGLRYAVGFDGGNPTTVNMHTELPANFTDTAPAWEKWVSDNIIVKSTSHTVTQAGEHALNLWMVDPGVVVQKIVVKTGTVPTSYLGPPARLPLNVELETVDAEIPPGDGAPVDPTDPSPTNPGNTGGTPGNPGNPGGGHGETSGDPGTDTTTAGNGPVGTDPSPTQTTGTPSGTTQPGASSPGGETTAGAGTTGATDSGSDGCGCSVPGSSRNNQTAWLGAAFALAGLVHGRRRFRR